MYTNGNTYRAVTISHSPQLLYFVTTTINHRAVRPWLPYLTQVPNTPLNSHAMHVNVAAIVGEGRHKQTAIGAQEPWADGV